MKKSGSYSFMGNQNIYPTDKEKQIFDLLCQVLRHYNLQTQLRVAGGWVRDKLLGIQCNDIDIAIDNMLGNDFCMEVKEYLASKGEETEQIIEIPSNPDQSKHLETARMCLFDVWIDFVNLRCEDYTQKSRIPSMRFGTAEEDAYRRDLTINSLFYNIHTCSVEDYTGRGLDDLKSGKIMTPLEPKKTFLDDRLRVLRAIRFSTRFEFEIGEELKIAAKDTDVKSAIVNKVKKERIKHEIELMVSGNQPSKAMAYLAEFGLFWVVFTPPPNCKPLISKENDKICVGYMDLAWKRMREVECGLTDRQRRCYLYASLFLPLWKTVYIDNKKKNLPVVRYIINTSEGDVVLRLYNGVEKFSSLIPFILFGEDMRVSWESDMIEVSKPLKSRILLGLLMREIEGLWRAALMLSSFLYKNEVEKGREVFMEVEQEILKLGLEKVWEIKPLINGNDVMRILGLQKGGPSVGKWERRLLQWQLANPLGSVNEYVDWMTMQMKLEGR